MKRKEIYAWLITGAVALPMLYMLGSALADGELRRRQTPLRAVLGDETYQQLKSGEQTAMHYLGNSRRAPDFSLRDQYGQPWRLADHRGKLVLMNFWSITCKPCVEEMPTLIQLAEILKDRDDVEVVAISTDSSWADVSTLFPKQNPLRVLFDPEKEIVRDKYGTKLYPETWIIDGRGVVRFRYDGSRDWSNPLTMDLIESFL